jgi:hypothetical protein
MINGGDAAAQAAMRAQLAGRLRDLATAAEAGEIGGIGVAIVRSDGRTDTALYVDAVTHPMTLLGVVVFVQGLILRATAPGARNGG